MKPGINKRIAFEENIVLLQEVCMRETLWCAELVKLFTDRFVLTSRPSKLNASTSKFSKSRVVDNPAW